MDRYRIDCEGYPVPCDNGDYVEYADVKDLKSQLDAANAENKRLNEAFENLSKSTRREIDCANEQYTILEQQLDAANAVIKQEAIFRNELKLTAMGWQDEENYCVCNNTELCGDQLLEFVKCHEQNND